jgi:hypothetical protein
MPDKLVAFLVGAICGTCAAFAIFPIYEKVLRIVKPIRERNEWFSYYLIGCIWLLSFSAMFVILPIGLLTRPSLFTYWNVFGVVALIRGISFRQRMIAEGLDPRTENKKYRI